jgi:hypothetical protein
LLKVNINFKKRRPLAAAKTGCSSMGENARGGMDYGQRA